jgi:hypothetical protein
MRPQTKPYRIITAAFTLVFTLTCFGSLQAISIGAMTQEQGQQGTSSGEFSGRTTENVQKESAPYKDPRLACLLSFIIPGGGGQFYLRNDVKAVVFCLGVSIGYLASAYFLFTGFLPSTGGSNFVIGAITGLVGLVIHIVSMVESYNNAVEINEARFYRNY